MPVHRYQYNGKEKLTDLGINNYDYGARHYDAALGRWFTIDPLAEKYKAWSAYNYTYDNPANNIDPDGRSVWSKVAKVGFKVGKTALKEGAQSLKKGATWADAVSDIIDDVATVANSSASPLDRVVSGLSLASELLPISAGDVKDLYKGGKKLLGVVDEVGDVGKKTLKIDVADTHKIKRELLDAPGTPGNAPTFKKDGTSVEIHHEGQKRTGPFKEMHQQDHRMGNNYRKNHPAGQKPLTKEERKEFNNAKKEYWRNEYPKQ